jgi:hypothetical protein
MNPAGSTHRRGALALIVITTASFVLVGCGGSTPATEESTPTPSASATPVDPAIVWADGVCRAAAGIRDRVKAVGDDLQFDPSSPESAADQVRKSLDARSTEIGAGIEVLGSAIGAVPVDVPQALELADTLDEEYTALTRSIDEAQTSIAAVTNSSGIVSFGLNAAAAIGAIRSAAEATASLTSTLSDAAGGASDSVSTAFAASTTCQALSDGLPVPASPSS